MDNRRGFFGKLLGLFGVAAFPIETKAVVAPPVAHEFKYKNFLIHWTGWKSSYTTDLQFGQWVAYENISDWRRKRLLYASYPGGEDRFYVGQLFDLSLKEGQIPVSWNTEDRDKIKCEVECLQRLIKLIDRNF